MFGIRFRELCCSVSWQVTKESQSMAVVAGRMGFFSMAEMVTTEGRTALAAAAAAADVNASAVKAMGRLGTLGAVARDVRCASHHPLFE